MTPAAPYRHERLAGTLRDEPWLALTPEMLAAREQLIVGAYYLYRLALFGRSVPAVAEQYDRITSPRLGDLVVESTRVLRGRGTAEDLMKGFGILLAVRPDDARADRTFLIQYGPDPTSVCSWGNADFIAVPIQRDSGNPW